VVQRDNILGLFYSLGIGDVQFSDRQRGDNAVSRSAKDRARRGVASRPSAPQLAGGDHGSIVEPSRHPDMRSKIGEYFDRIYVIHLPERVDRYVALRRALGTLGIDIRGPKVRIPAAPRPDDSNQFPSRAVYGNFLSHLEILKESRKDGLSNVLILEDDAMFSRRMVKTQAALVETLQNVPWDLCFFGHSLKDELRGYPKGLVSHKASFIWAHCYAANARVFTKLIDYMEITTTRPPGHPLGARMYIDAVFTHFRLQNPEITTLVSNPVLSLQRGSPSSIASHGWYPSLRWVHPIINLVRAARDQLWRHTS
jgi:glycosyl transferase family 25